MAGGGRVLMVADLALVVLGTATVEALLCRCPMVVAYRVSAATALRVRGLRLVRLPQFSLPNLLAGKALVPEFFQEAATPANLFPLRNDASGSREMFQLLRIRDVEHLTGLSRSTIYRLEAAGSFPARVRPSQRTTAWRGHEVAQWINTRTPKRTLNPADSTAEEALHAGRSGHSEIVTPIPRSRQHTVVDPDGFQMSRNHHE